jgi:hypothetical protein
VLAPPKASTVQEPDWVQNEPASQSRSRAQLPIVQWPVERSHVAGGEQEVVAHPGMQAPAEQMKLGAPTHSASLLHRVPASGGRGQPCALGSQQWPVARLQMAPDTQRGPDAHPVTHVCVESRQTVSGGEQLSSFEQLRPI